MLHILDPGSLVDAQKLHLENFPQIVKDEEKYALLPKVSGSVTSTASIRPRAESCIDAPRHERRVR